MSYEQIDFICDSYNPTLFIIVLLMIGLGIKVGGGFSKGRGIFLASVVTSYLIVALERKVGAWGYFGMDFSTHTMISIVFASWIWRLAPSTTVLSLVGLQLLFIGGNGVPEIPFDSGHPHYGGYNRRCYLFVRILVI